MTFIDTWVTQLLTLFPHPYFLPFIGAIVGGEGIIFLTAILSAHGALPFTAVLIASYLGTFISDGVWFFVGKRSMHRVESLPYIHGRIEKIATFTRDFTRKRYLVTLIVTKFLYGTRIVTIAYMAREGMSFRQFCAYNGIATGIWVTVVCTLGWLTGRGIVWLESGLRDVSLVVGIAVGGVLLLYLLRMWVSRRIITK